LRVSHSTSPQSFERSSLFIWLVSFGYFFLSLWAVVRTFFSYWIHSPLSIPIESRVSKGREQHETNENIETKVQFRAGLTTKNYGIRAATFESSSWSAAFARSAELAKPLSVFLSYFSFPLPTFLQDDFHSSSRICLLLLPPQIRSTRSR